MSDRSEALQVRLIATFRVEAEEHLRIIRAELDAIAGAPPDVNTSSMVETLFRTMHTLKGAARSVGIAEVEATCHRFETLLHTSITDQQRLDNQTLRILGDAADALSSYVAGSAQVERLTLLDFGSHHANGNGSMLNPAAQKIVPAPTGTAGGPAAAPATATIRVEIARLDRLVSLSEDLLIPKLAASVRAQVARGVVDELQEIRSRSRDAALSETIHSLETRVGRLATDLAGDSKALRTTVDALSGEMHHVRLTPASVMLQSFPLMVRELCRETGKEVIWQVSGEELEVDRKVLDLLKDPLIHLVRNAIDHGIEAPNSRLKKKKPRQGTVAVKFFPVQGGRVLVEVADDGAGFDFGGIRDAAVRSHLSSSDQVGAMDDDSVVDLAYRAGVSTSPVVTKISGHGRGLAIVRECIERIEGRLRTISSPAGTTIRLELPTSIAVYRGLLVKTEDQLFLIPAESVERVIGVDSGRVGAALANGFLGHGGQMLAFGRLGPALGLRPAARDREDERRTLPAVVVRGHERRGILLVDEILGEQEVMVKELGLPLNRVRNILAGGLLGTGDLTLILRPSDVLSSIHAKVANAEEADEHQVMHAPRVLVVDDSTTTRTMEQNLFEAAGYIVSVAANGIGAWSVIERGEVDIVVSDVDMPEMDGFALTSRIRSDPRLTDLPVVLVTALETREDKERGLRVGANAYVLKSGFDQSDLLEIVRRLT